MNELTLFKRINQLSSMAKNLKQVHIKFNFLDNLSQNGILKITPTCSNDEVTQRIKEHIEESTNEIISLLFEMETIILNKGFIPFEIGAQLKIHKAIILVCKRALFLPKIDEINFPDWFCEEYKSLLARVKKAILSVQERLIRLNNSENEPVKCLLEKNLLTLKMLYFHYLVTLGIEE